MKGERIIKLLVFLLIIKTGYSELPLDFAQKLGNKRLKETNKGKIKSNALRDINYFAILVGIADYPNFATF
jgi:hypothetical protein